MHEDKFYNSAVLTGPEGFIGVYRKTHLYFEENLYFTPGDTGFRVWDTKAGRIGIMICFDWFFPEAMRTLALSGADIVAHPSNLVLPYCPDSMPLRCLENRVFAITANRTGTENRKEGSSLRFIGKSEIVSPEGEILVRAPEAEEALMVKTLIRQPQETRPSIHLTIFLKTEGLKCIGFRIKSNLSYTLRHSRKRSASGIFPGSGFRTSRNDRQSEFINRL